MNAALPFIAQHSRMLNGSILLSLEQRTEAWHDWRKGRDLADGKPRITGTAAAIIHGGYPFKTLHGLWRELMGLADPDPLNYVMQRGIDLEDLARELYVAFTGNDVVPICVQHPEIEWAGASLDGLETEMGEIINETKCVGKKTHAYAVNGLLPPYYIPQTQWQLLCTPSAREVHYWSLDADEIIRLRRSGATIDTHMDEFLSHCRVVVVRPDPVMQAALLKDTAEFRQHLIDGTPPAGDAWLFAAREYVLAKAALDEATANVKTAEKELIDCIPAEKRDIDGTKVEGGGACVTYYSAEGTVDYAKLIADLNISAETVAKYRKEQSIRKRVSVTGEMPIQLPSNKVKLVLPTYVASGTPARELAHW